VALEDSGRSANGCRDCADFGEAAFRSGTKRGTPPMFLEECASGRESLAWRSVENKCVQAIEREAVRGEVCSKKEGDFTE
jgi:hypothetical protein